VPWPLPSDDAALLALAKAYPFGLFPASYLLRAIRDPAFRQALIGAMGEAAVPTAAPHFTELNR
jgi:hypothetical protein